MSKNAISILICLFITSYCFAVEKEKAADNYGSAVIEKIQSVENGYIFRCNIKGWPAIVGEDIPIVINGIKPPVLMVSNISETENQKKQLESSIIDFVKARLAAHLPNERVILQNIQRGPTFCLVADVIVDSNSLADILIDNGMASEGSSEDTTPVDIISSSQVVIRQKMKPEASLQAIERYTASKSSKVFHRSTCTIVRRISEQNKVYFATREQAVQTGRRPCQRCNP